jgi:hypothetical protein
MPPAIASLSKKTWSDRSAAPGKGRHCGDDQ